MERLTDKRMKGEGFILVDPKEYKTFIRKEKPTGKQIYQRLLDIEDILGDNYDLDRLRELVKADRENRCFLFPKDGMVYYIEEAGGERWIANKPIQQVTVRCGWGFASLEFSLFDTGKYFTREAAEAALKGE